MLFVRASHTHSPRLVRHGRLLPTAYQLPAASLQVADEAREAVRAQDDGLGEYSDFAR
jgi:hypothetical protein